MNKFSSRLMFVDADTPDDEAKQRIADAIANLVRDTLISLDGAWQKADRLDIDIEVLRNFTNQDGDTYADYNLRITEIEASRHTNQYWMADDEHE